MSGFYLIAGLFLWTLYRDRQATRWGAWLLGSLAGAVPLLPWAQYLLANMGKGTGLMNFFWLLEPKYWIFWVSDSLGLGFTHSLRWAGFFEFLRYPLIGGTATYLVGIVHLFVLYLAIRIFLPVKNDRGGSKKRFSDVSETGLLLNALFVVSGLLMTLSCFKINQHYLIMTFPLEWVWLSRLGLRDGGSGPKRLMWLWAAQAIISIAFLGFIHANHGFPAGDYGTAYQYQAP
jgi:hypothetical protein